MTVKKNLQFYVFEIIHLYKKNLSKFCKLQ